MKKKILFWTTSLLLLTGAAIYAQDRNGWLGHMFFTQTSPEVRFNGTMKFQTFSGGNLFQIAQSAQTPALTFGPSGSQLTQARSYRQALTPAALAPFGTSDQTFTVTGLSVTDYVFMAPPSIGTNPSACAPVTARASATDTVRITFWAGSATCTPPVGVYTFWAFRT